VLHGSFPDASGAIQRAHGRESGPLLSGWSASGFPAVGQQVAQDSVPDRTTACVLLSVTSEA
jgi:hypothetical protein